MPISPCERTLALLRGQGYLCARTEHWNAFARRRQDLFGWIDIVAVKAVEPIERGVWGVQVTNGANHAARVTKIRALPAVRTWLRAENGVLVVSWAKRGARGKRKVWTPRVEALSAADMRTGTIVGVGVGASA